jgi:hypothetical protein
MGIEPTLVAWEATVLPLNYTRSSPDFTRVSARWVIVWACTAAEARPRPFDELYTGGGLRSEKGPFQEGQ